MKLEEILQNHKLWLETRYSSKVKGERANLRGADLCEADLRGVNLQCANLYMADLSRANLQGADLRRADLRGTDLREANLRDVDLRSANLQGADLSGVDLRGANIDFISVPLQCSGLYWKMDKKLMVQLLYHFCTHECEDEEIKEAQNYLLPLANEFHRIGMDCKKLESKK